MENYDANNIFAKILRAESPCVKVFEDEFTLAFMDIMPQANGHVLVIPKSPARNLLDVEDQALAQLAVTLKKIANGIKAAVNANGMTVVQNNESAGGQVVFHLHFHLIPRFAGDGWRFGPGPMRPLEALEPTAAKIRAALEKI
jgi:histidine triad (HIT) family protein